MKKRAYGKINLGLKVIKKREDGFHEIETVMTRISLYDEMTFTESDKIEVECTGLTLAMKDNLVYKVALYLKEKYQVSKGIKINIKKMIPSEAGLGGGSSDAAMTIMCLNKIWNLKMRRIDMMKTANLFGSDIAFFLLNEPCFVYGKGDKMRYIKIKNKLFLVLVKPSFGVETKKAFSMVDEYSESGYLDKLIEILNSGDIKDIECEISNDLEKAILKDDKYSKIKVIEKELLSSGAMFASMSGSGSSVYAAFKDKKMQEVAYKNMLKNGYQAYKIYNK